MIKHILVPVDGSSRAERALPFAVQIARGSGSTLSLIQVIQAPSPQQREAEKDTNKARLDSVQHYLTQLARQDEYSDVPIHTEVLTGDDIADTLLNFAKHQEIELIVLCSHGYTGFKRWTLGSVAQQIARRSPLPVMVIGEDGYVPQGAHPDPHRPLRVVSALVALDGSWRAEAALYPTAQIVTALAAPHRGAIRLLHVVKTHGTHPSATERTMIEEAEIYLCTVAKRLQQEIAPQFNLEVTHAVVQSSNIAQGILHTAEEGEHIFYGGQDLIALTTHGRSGLSRMVLGSVAERILGHTPLPLLIVQPQELT